MALQFSNTEVKSLHHEDHYPSQYKTIFIRVVLTSGFMSESFNFAANKLDIIQGLPSSISTNGHYDKNSLRLSVLHREYVSNN